MRRSVYVLVGLVLAGPVTRAADPALDNVVHNHAQRVEQARRQYETSVQAADRDATLRLTQLMNARQNAGDARGAAAVRQALDALQAGGAVATQENRAAAEIEKRCLALHRALIDNNLDQALTYIDPKNLNFVQPAAAKAYLGVWAGMLKVGQVTAQDVKVAQVRLGVKGNEAVVETRLRVRGNWDDQKPSYWVYRDGQWYLGDEKEIANFK